MSGTPNLETVAELVGSAYINLQNMARSSPALAGDPFFRIVRRQLGDALNELGHAPVELQNLEAPGRR